MTRGARKKYPRLSALTRPRPRHSTLPSLSSLWVLPLHALTITLHRLALACGRRGDVRHRPPRLSSVAEAPSDSVSHAVTAARSTQADVDEHRRRVLRRQLRGWAMGADAGWRADGRRRQTPAGEFF